MAEVTAKLQDVFRQVFDDNGLVIRDDMDAGDIDGWDSLQHINLVIATEKAFAIKFTTAEISRLKQPGQNIGSFVRLLETKVNAR
jgi:acyl carrier protein